MVKVYRNMDILQKVAFRKIEDLKVWMLKNENSCDGLAWGYIEDFNEFDVNMIYIEDEWQVEYYPDFETNVLDTFEEAVEEFIKFVKENNNE